MFFHFPGVGVFSLLVFHSHVSAVFFMFDVVLEEDWGPDVCGQTSYRMICLDVACATDQW